MIGILTLLGLKPARQGDWSWAGYLKEHKGLIGLGAFGLLGAGIMCYFLFRVQAAEQFWGVYPVWLLFWGLAYIVIVVALALTHLHQQTSRLPVYRSGPASDPSPAAKTARLWITPLLAILFYMHALIIFVSVTGAEFR